MRAGANRISALTRIWAILLSFAVLAPLGGCEANPSKSQSVEFFTMDTLMSLTACGKNAGAALRAAQAEIIRLDRLFSISNPESDVYLVNHNGGAALCAETAALVRESIGLYELTDGAFDITVYPLMDAWGFYSGEYRVPSDEERARLLALAGSGKLALEGDALALSLPGMGIDLGGIAKGYASDRAAETLAENGVTSALISLGGNIMTLGARPDGTPWRIAIRDPLDESAYAGIVRVANMAVVTSGGYERYFELDARSYHHILDPATGMPAQSGLISATIVCESGMLADGLSTALFVMGEEKALSFWRAHADLFDFVLVADEGRILVSAGIADAFSSERGFEVVR